MCRVRLVAATALALAASARAAALQAGGAPVAPPADPARADTLGALRGNSTTRPARAAALAAARSAAFAEWADAERAAKLSEEERRLALAAVEGGGDDDGGGGAAANLTAAARAKRTLRTFSRGSKQLLADFREFWRLRRARREGGALSWREARLLRELPRELWKVGI